MDGVCVEDGRSRPSTTTPDAKLGFSGAPRPARRLPLVFLAVFGLLGLVCGCASGRIPMIDPTGERFFIAGPVMRQSEPPPAHCHDPVRIELTPNRVIAPVGCEVVLLAGVCGPDGYLRARQPVEWMLAPGGVGQFLTVGRRGPLDWLAGFYSGPHKINNTYAVGTTSSSYLCLTRGTPTCDDDLPVERGQAWVAVTSPVEGVSYVTAYAPGVKAWDSHTQTSTIHWIDADLAYPPAAVNPGGSRHTFTTTITRHSTRAPVAGWRVRYEITGGPAAGFAPDGGPLVEVTSNELGQASAEIYQLDAKPGTNTVSIQVIRPADATGDRFVVGQGATQKTWTAPDISLDASGPGQGLVGDTLTYRIDVRNPGDFTAKEVTVTETLGEGVTMVAGTPPTSGAGRLQWLLGDLQAGEARTITLQLRADRAGTVNNCASVTTAEKLSAQDCVATTILAPSLRVTMTGPPQAEVGQPVTFQMQITNAGSSALTGLVIVDRYDAGLEHASQPRTQTRVIERTLGELAAGQTKNVDVELNVVQAGRQCNAVEIHGTAGVLGSAKACLTAEEPGAAPAGGQTKLTVTKDGPPTQVEGGTATFTIRVTNTGQTAATNLTVTDHFDPSLTPTEASNGFQQDGADLIWRIDRIAPGKSIQLRLKCQCTEAGENICNRVTVTSDQGDRETAEACLNVTSASAGLQPSIDEVGDPVTVGQQTTYRITVANKGTAAEQNVVVKVTVPDLMTPLSAGDQSGTPAKPSSRTIRFAPVATLAAGKSLTYSVVVRADKTGSDVARVEVTSQNQATPLTAETTTTVVK